jgi:hypothetical protein
MLHDIEQLHDALSEEPRIQAMVAELPELDRRTSDEILGYDDHGLPS